MKFIYSTSSAQNWWRVFIFTITISLSVTGLSQKLTKIEIPGGIQQSSVNRLGVNLGDQTYWDSGQLLKNLIFRNPGFEGMKYRSILKCSQVTANTCTDDNQFSGQGTGFWKGGSYLILSGNSAGVTGTVEASTKNPHNCSGCGQIITFDKDINAAVGDYFVVTNEFPGHGDAGWWDNTQNGGSISTEMKDLSPNTVGKQALLLKASGSGQIAGVSSYFDSTSNVSFIQMNGNFQVTFRAKGVGGNNQLVVSVQRSGNGSAAFLNQTVNLTPTWRDYTLPFTANENGSAVGTLALSFQAAGAAAELDDVSLQQTNSSASNTTAFRDDVVNTLKQLNPGTIRMMASGAALGSDLINQIQLPMARYREGFNSGGTEVDDVAYGIHEFLQLCQAVGAEPWITIPTATTPAEMTAFIQYLTGTGGDQYSALRISRGQAAPWSTVFNKIHIELGNETWNGDFKGESMSYPAYPLWANKVFGAARAVSDFKASQFDLVLDGWSAVPAYTQGELSYSTQHDSIDIAPYLLFSLKNESQELQFGAMFAEPELFDSPGGQVYQNLQFASAASRPANLNIYETNLGSIVGTPTQEQLNATQPSVGAGIAHIDHMLQMMRIGVKYQNAFSLPQFEFQRGDGSLVHLWGLVFDMGTTNRRRPQFLTQALANSVIGGTMLKTIQSGTNPTWNQPLSSDDVKLKGAHEIQSFAFDNNGTVSVILINLSQSTANEVAITGAKAPSGTVQMSQITSEKITDNNENSDLVRTTSKSLSNFNTSTVLSLPPFSMTVLTSGSGPAGSSPEVDQPQFSVVPGTYGGPQTVKITDGTPGAEIYYTTDGSEPSTGSNLYRAPLQVESTLGIKAIAVAPKYRDSSIAEALYSILPKGKITPTPQFTESPGTYNDPITIGLSVGVNGASIYYTTDGTEPTTLKTRFTKPITVAKTVTIKAIAIVANHPQSSLLTGTFTIQPKLKTAASPQFTVPAGRYSTVITVSIKDATPGAVIHYTKNGATPSNYSAQYTGPIVVNSTQTIKAIAIAKDYASSPEASALYTIELATLPPIFSKRPGTYYKHQGLNITDATPGAVIHYTRNGATPSVDSAVFTGIFDIASTETIKAIAVAPDHSVSAVTAGTFTIISPTSAPTFSKAPGRYDKFQWIDIKDSTPGASIYYTLNGTDPTEQSTRYTGLVDVSKTETVKAIAIAPGHSMSPVTAGTFTITNASSTPRFSVMPGTYKDQVEVVIEDSTPRAEIHYALKGESAQMYSAKYTGPILVSATDTISAMAIAPNFTNSDQASATYTIVHGSNVPTTAAPVFSLKPGTYFQTQQVEISDSTSGAEIYYSVNGSAPVRYTTPISVAATLSIVAIATAKNHTTSQEVTSKYVIAEDNKTPVGDAETMEVHGSAQKLGQTLRLTAGSPGQTGVAWCKNKLPITSFNASFTMQMPQSKADGLTFTIQNNYKGSWALGVGGDGLAYLGIGQSVAVKFALWDNVAATQVSQTGLLLNGVSPKTQTIDMSRSNISLHNGHLLAVQLAYDGATLQETVTDTVTKAVFSQSYTVDIPSIIGGSKAYVGFTGSTGAFTSVQDVGSFSYASTAKGE